MNESVSSNNPCAGFVSFTTAGPTSTTVNFSSVITTPASTLQPTAAAAAITTPSVMSMSMTIATDYDSSLASNTEEYKTLSNTIQSAIDQSYRNLSAYIAGSAKVTRFRSGSTIADYNITATSSNLNMMSANTLLANNLRQLGIPVDANAFAESVETILSNTTNKLYPLQSVELRCIRTGRDVVIEGEITWMVNKMNPALDPDRYSILNNGSTLIVKNASESDSGRYSCTINRTTTPYIPYIQWQDIVIEQRSNIEVENRVFDCKDQTVPLKCCAARYSIEWVPIPAGDQVNDSESGCITLQHKLQKVNCGKEETFTCRLKDLSYLQDYSYSRKSITIKTASVERYDCAHQTLGIGQRGDLVKGLCESGWTGYIIYQCSSESWQKIQDECVLIPIETLQNTATDLSVEGVPVFMANLSRTVNQLASMITQSSANVKAIVGILLQVADVSQNMTIDKLVMNQYLDTVDVLISDKSSNTWGELNNVNTTSNTSTGLLQAIENISGHLSEVNFTLNQSSIQLNRTKVENSFIGTSQLPNSTTQVVIPNISKPTFITVIFFTKLDNVLPTRSTSNNDSRASENRINGDVVVVKVNETINNILFAFNIMDTSLGNPQCVFWNFNLNRWDSAGCKVKISGKETVTCECDHTTSFSILMSPYFVNDSTLSYITYIGVAISIFCLILCLIIETIVWKSVTKNDTSYMRHVSIVNIAVSLLIADIWFIIGAAISNPGQLTPVNSCSAAVFFMHFFYLALFFWMFISALLLLYRTVMVFSQMSRTNMMAIAFTVGYGAPLLIAVITVASTAGAGRYIWTRDACWLNWNESKALLAFVIPALMIVAFNLLVLVVVSCKMLKRSANASTLPDERHVLVVIIRCVAILTPIFGLTWGFGIGIIVSDVYGLHVVFAVLNSFQGFFVLVFGTILDSKARQSLAGKLKWNLSSDSTKSTSAGASSSNRQGIFARLRWRYVYHVSNPNTSSGPSS